MSFRSLIRLLLLAVTCLLLTIPLWRIAGVGPLLVGPGLLLLTLAYLSLTTGGTPLTHWQLRYYLPVDVRVGPEANTPSDSHGERRGQAEGRAVDANLDRLEEALGFLAARSGHLVLEASAEGLTLELPQAFDAYVEAQLPRALPEVRLVRAENGSGENPGGTRYLSLGLPNSQALRWATEGVGRQVRLHIHPGPYTTVTAQVDGPRPPGTWLRIQLPRSLHKLWHHLPVWDELSAGVRLSSLLPATDDGAVYSSRSRLLGLKPPDGYQPAEGDRHLGWSVDGRPLTLSHAVPLFTAGAPASFLASQIAGDLERGGTVIVASPDRRFLDRVRHETAPSAMVYRLDPQNSHASARLVVVPAAEWPRQEMDIVIELAETFLHDLGLDVNLPTIEGFARRLVYLLASFSRESGRDLSFVDLYSVSQSARSLQAFLADLQQLGFDNNPTGRRYIQELLEQTAGDEGYVQAIAILSTVRAGLSPLRSGPLHELCQGPYFSSNGASPEGARLVLVPMTNVDFREHDRLLGAMLDLTLNRMLATDGEDLRLSLHLHDPHHYRRDGGRRWIDVARQDPRLSLLLHVTDPEVYVRVPGREDGVEMVFRCAGSLASTVIRDWDLPATPTELGELPDGVAVARLDDMVVTLEVEA